MFEAISGLFPKIIKVALFDAHTGASLGLYKIPAEQLRVSFNRPTTIEIENTNWRILKAEPSTADKFLFSRRLKLQVQNLTDVEESQLYFSLPSVCKELPLTGSTCLYSDFTLEISQCDWQQIEFRSMQEAPAIEQEITQVNFILTSQPNPLLGVIYQYM